MKFHAIIPHLLPGSFLFSLSSLGAANASVRGREPNVLSSPSHGSFSPKARRKDDNHRLIIQTECTPLKKGDADIGILNQCPEGYYCMASGEPTNELGGMCRKRIVANSHTESRKLEQAEGCISLCSRSTLRAYGGSSVIKGKGCCNSACQAKVCAVNSDCCDIGWNNDCVFLAAYDLYSCYYVENCTYEELYTCDGGAEPANCGETCEEYTSYAYSGVLVDPLDCDVEGCLEKICAVRPDSTYCCTDAFLGWGPACYEFGFLPPRENEPNPELYQLCATPGQICGYGDLTDACKGDKKIEVCIETLAEEEDTSGRRRKRLLHPESKGGKSKSKNNSPFQTTCVDPAKHLKSSKKRRQRVDSCGPCENE